ncbi:hypothetical protein K4F52_002317 [Lecanicillium sp. MT-2017a]|nr:hypothetical protein K4F52_002317 [Lecanicillium sp. MT-2017a]
MVIGAPGVQTKRRCPGSECFLAPVAASCGSRSPDREDPASAPRLEITGGEGRDFISIGDYISQTNEWLVSLRPKILKEVGLQTDCRVWEPDTELWVDPRFPACVSFIHDREGTAWRDWHQIAEKASQG